MKPRFFRSATEFRKWLDRNHEKEAELWVGFQKLKTGEASLSSKEAIDQALCFGWSYGTIKSLDPYSYMIRFLRRKAKSTWSSNSIKRAKELQKQGLLHSSGLKALHSRRRHQLENKHPEFTVAQLKRFKTNKKAWAFFAKQTPSYQRYMKAWVITAKKTETQEKRLQMLIDDSARESKLARVLKAQEKTKKVYKPGETPIEAAKNIGLVSGSELRSVGIETLEQLQAMGWENAFSRMCELYPHRLNLNMLTSLIGAVENQHWQKIDPDLKAEARALLREMRESMR